MTRQSLLATIQAVRRQYSGGGGRNRTNIPRKQEENATFCRLFKPIQSTLIIAPPMLVGVRFGVRSDLHRTLRRKSSPTCTRRRSEKARPVSGGANAVLAKSRRRMRFSMDDRSWAERQSARRSEGPDAQLASIVAEAHWRSLPTAPWRATILSSLPHVTAEQRGELSDRPVSPPRRRKPANPETGQCRK